jgi:hypothetical protein
MDQTGALTVLVSMFYIKPEILKNGRFVKIFIFFFFDLFVVVIGTHSHEICGHSRLSFIRFTVCMYVNQNGHR